MNKLYIWIVLICSLMIIQLGVFAHNTEKKVETPKKVIEVEKNITEKVEKNENKDKIENKNEIEKKNEDNKQIEKGIPGEALVEDKKEEASHAYMIPYVLVGDILVMIFGIAVIIVERKKYFLTKI